VPKKRELLTYETVRKFLDYNQETGQLTWKPRERRWFTSTHQCNAFNSKHAYKEAFTAYNDRKRKVRAGKLLGQTYLAHHIIWLWKTGEWPSTGMDHKDGNPENNRWDNLAEAPQSINNKNARLRSDNKSGTHGVYQTQSGNYIVGIGVNGKWVTLGTFQTKEQAVLVRKQAEQKFGYSKRHGT
jgi:hypothetical protein